jgi:CheY-like chemotaxis protein
MTLSERIGTELPFLRRFARAITGSQRGGDAYVASALEAIIADPAVISDQEAVRVDLYKILVRLINSVRVNARSDDLERAESAEEKLQLITPKARQAFLLVTVEELSLDQAAEVMETSVDELSKLLNQASSEIAAQIATDVLIIEDEPLIALDLKDIVSQLGHRVTGVARTEKEALAAVAKHRPGLVLADIQLADGSSGLDAVGKFLKTGDLPVIFVTAFPERLLTGTRPEPTFLITKPFQPEVLRAIISQALFFDVKAHSSSK